MKIEELLNEAGWLRGLAASLVGWCSLRASPAPWTPVIDGSSERED